MAEVTVIVTASGSAPFLYVTVRAVAASVARARAAGHVLDIVVVADQPDAQTARLLRRAAPLVSTVSTITSPGRIDADCVGAARQHAINAGTADTLFFHQAGELVSPDYHERFLAFAARARSDGLGEMVLHPELVATYGAATSVVRSIRSDDSMFDPLSLIAAPVFSSMPMCGRAVVEASPMAGRDAGRGIGEDNWRWVAETLGRGVPHLFVPETVGFARHAAPKTRRVMGRSILFDPLTIRESRARTRRRRRPIGAIRRACFVRCRTATIRLIATRCRSARFFSSTRPPSPRSSRHWTCSPRLRSCNHEQNCPPS